MRCSDPDDRTLCIQAAGVLPELKNYFVILSDMYRVIDMEIFVFDGCLSVMLDIRLACLTNVRQKTKSVINGTTQVSHT